MDRKKELEHLLVLNNGDKFKFQVELLSLNVMGDVFNLMKIKNMSQGELENKIGITMDDLFSGEAIITLEQLIKLQDIFNVTFNINCIEN